MVQNHSGEANTSSSTHDKLSAFYGIRVFITLFTTTRHLTPSQGRRIQFTLCQPISLSFTILIRVLPSNVQLTFQVVSLFKIPQQNRVFISLLPHYKFK
jgi:hypothetical protein